MNVFLHECVNILTFSSLKLLSTLNPAISPGAELWLLALVLTPSPGHRTWQQFYMVFKLMSCCNVTGMSLGALFSVFTKGLTPV